MRISTWVTRNCVPFMAGSATELLHNQKRTYYERDQPNSREKMIVALGGSESDY